MIQNFEYIVAFIVMCIGVYCVVAKKNLIKKIIGLGMMTDAVHLFLIELGFKKGGVVPIVTDLNKFNNFVSKAVDPLPQALVLTSIVINISITAFALAISIKTFQSYKTLNTNKISELRG